MEWFKFYGKDFLTDTKIKRLTVLRQLMFVKLLCHASDDSNGVVRYVSEWDLALECGVTETSDFADDVVGFFEQLQEMNMVKIGENFVTLIHYKERQETNLSGAERAKRYRDKHSQSDDSNVTESDDSNARVEKSRVEESREDKNTTIKSASADVRDNSFDTFWTTYPRKELKKKSYEIWKRKKLSEKLEQIVSFIEKAKATERWQGGFVKQPTTFLNNECWNDDIKSYNSLQESKMIYL